MIGRPVAHHGRVDHPRRSRVVLRVDQVRRGEVVGEPCIAGLDGVDHLPVVLQYRQPLVDRARCCGRVTRLDQLGSCADHSISSAPASMIIVWFPQQVDQRFVVAPARRTWPAADRRRLRPPRRAAGAAQAPPCSSVGALRTQRRARGLDLSSAPPTSDSPTSWDPSTKPIVYATFAALGRRTTAPPSFPRRTRSNPSASRIRIASRSDGLLTGNSSSSSSSLGSMLPSARSPRRMRRRSWSATCSARRRN